jgi:hypothetical protein
VRPWLYSATSRNGQGEAVPRGQWNGQQPRLRSVSMLPSRFPEVQAYPELKAGPRTPRGYAVCRSKGSDAASRLHGALWDESHNRSSIVRCHLGLLHLLLQLQRALTQSARDFWAGVQRDPPRLLPLGCGPGT